MADFELTTTATLPANTSVTVTVYEDTDSDGTAENSASQSISDGTNTYTLSGFDGSSGNDVWVQIGPANSDVTTTASVDSVDVAVPVTAPSTPQNLTSSVSADDITLNWDSVNWNGDQGHYNVYRKYDGSSYSDIADVSSGTTSYTDSALLDGEQYTYYVDAVNSAGSSGNSNTTSSTTALPAPSNLTLS